METIDYSRWAIYLVFGTPFLAWLLFTRNDALRVAAVVGVLVIVQDAISARRYLWAVGVGPSVITAYVAAMGIYLQRGRPPRLGWLGPGWLLFLGLALSGVVIGSFVGGQLPWNVKTFQELFLESFLFFLIGAMVFRSDLEARQFFAYLVLLAGVTAVIHFATLATGYRFANVTAGAISQWVYGGVFGNPNSMGSFYCMAFPTGLLLLLRGGLPRIVRPVLAISLVLMLGSLLISTHRGGILVTSLLSAIVVLRSGIRLASIAVGGALAAIVVGAAVWTVTLILPDVVAMAKDLFAQEGFKTERLAIWLTCLDLIAANPFGVGLAPENLHLALERYGLPIASPHSIYLTIPMQVGILGLLLFLAMVSSIITRMLRALRLATMPLQRLNIGCALLCVAAFLIAGVAEPIWENGQKLNNLFWLFSGIGLSLSERVLAQRRSGAPVASVVAPGAGLPAHGA